MRLGDIAAAALQDRLPVIRRWIAGILVIAVCAAATLIELTSAARHYFEPLVGPVWCRLIIAAFYLFVGACAALTLRYSGRRYAASHGKAGASDDALRRKFSILAEAVDVGISLGRDFRKAAQPNGKDDQGGESASATGTESAAREPASL